MSQRELGGSGFFGRLQPDCVVTDDSEAERAALREIWPKAKQFLCVFHVLQAAWRWLWLAKHKIPFQTKFHSKILSNSEVTGILAVKRGL